jgi:hypothetical protein
MKKNGSEAENTIIPSLKQVKRWEQVPGSGKIRVIIKKHPAVKRSLRVILVLFTFACTTAPGPAVR